MYTFLDYYFFFLGKGKECYSCIVDSEDHNKTSLSDSIASIALVVGVTIPTEYCNISKDLNTYTTCSTLRFCVKAVIESKSFSRQIFNYKLNSFQFSKL